MKHVLRTLVFLIAVLVVAWPASAQWECLYATYDDDVNGTGNQTSSVGVIKENLFVALVTYSLQNSYMISYANADSALGRLYTYGYGGATDAIRETWSDGGFDFVTMANAWHCRATPDSLIYVASNDDDHNILVFKFTGDTVVAVDPYPRQKTGTTTIFGIDVDANGYVYVCSDTSIGVAEDIKVYAPIAQWTPGIHMDPPMTTVNLPDGIYKGLAVSPNGSMIFVADLSNRRVLKFVGSPSTGYTQDNGFSFQLAAADSIPNNPAGVSEPVGLAYLTPNNILAVSCAEFSYSYSSSLTNCSYGRIYLLNPNTGAFVDPDPSIHLIDIAKWGYDLVGSYGSRPNGTTPGIASSYATPYDVVFDENGFLYTVSYWGWTVEKWRYNGTLPTIPVTSVAGRTDLVPEGFTLAQNYPNPFNPTTTIEFAVPAAGRVTLKVYDLLGREVASLVDEEKPAGSYRVLFNARNLPSGTYLYSLRTVTGTDVKKMTLLK
ncbi:MAG: T9SS type A sorting domain-containing protein [Bacteroidota bacterium]